MLTIKLSDEQMAKFKIANVADHLAILEAQTECWNRIEALTKENETNIMEHTTLSTKIDAVEARLGKLETSVSTAKPIDTEDILKQAKATASQEVIAAIAKIGGSAIRQPDKPADVTDDIPAGSGTTEADFSVEYKRSKNLQDEFITEAGYVMFRKKEAEGLIRFSTKPQST